MLPVDSLVTDLIFKANAQMDQATLLEALGGEEALKTKAVIEPDSMDPRLDAQLGPTRPFRGRGEGRLLIIDDSVAPLRKDPQKDFIVEKDLRPAKEELIKICQALPVKLGRLMALGTVGDAVVVARSARDLRGLALVMWIMDPQTDVDGRRRATPLSQKEFEAKIVAFDKRLDEIDDDDILANLPGVNVERRDELIVVDVLDAQGHWDLRNSIALEQMLAAIDRFSLLPGAPAAKRVGATPAPSSAAGATVAAVPSSPTAAPRQAPPAAPVAPAKPAGPPLTTAEVGNRVLLVFPPERFDLDVAAALGKKDWDRVLTGKDGLDGATRDRVFREGADWVAPLEFLSEVFVEGKPLNKQAFETAGQMDGNGVRTLPVHFPRFGPVLLIDLAGRGRYVTSATSHAPDIIKLL